MQYNAYLFLIPLFPLLGAIINGALALSTSQFQKGPSEKLVGTIAVLSVAMSFGLVLYFAGTMDALFKDSGHQLFNPYYTQTLWTWFSAGGIDVNFSFLFDRLSSMMLMFITGIGSLIHLYSIGYMKGDRGFARFMAYMNLFMFSMIMLVLGGNLLVTFLGWEGVGLCSYLLIGFWHHDHLNNDAARKAFITNRVGDLGFLLGTFVLFYAMYTGAEAGVQFDFHGISQWASALGLGGATGTPIPEQTSDLICLATFLLFFACTAKSAQIPLLTWLPDAMAGPTPVSALIHAATMVTAGVFLVCRMSDLFVLSPTTMTIITIVGILTALYAAICAVFQWDIKKVLAYSTVSQLGFMFMAVGIGAFDVALFHVFTHAFFKATLFLGAGSIIHSLHHEQDMRNMGRLQKKMPVTYAAMFIAWWAICGLPLGAGFMSKDLILERLFFFGGDSQTFGIVMWALAIIAASLTAFYMTRLLILTFYGNDRVDHEHVGPVKEAPLVMSLPVVILGCGSLFAGLAWCDSVLIPLMKLTGETKLVDFEGMRWLTVYLQPSLYNGVLASGETTTAYAFTDNPLSHAISIVILGFVGVLFAGLGCLLAWFKFRHGLDGDQRKLEDIKGFGKQWTFVFDNIYELIICRPVIFCSKAIYKFFDQLVLGNIIKGIGVSVQYIGDGCRGLQRGHVRISMAISLIGILVLFALVIFGSY